MTRRDYPEPLALVEDAIQIIVFIRWIQQIRRTEIVTHETSIIDIEIDAGRINHTSTLIAISNNQCSIFLRLIEVLRLI